MRRARFLGAVGVMALALVQAEPARAHADMWTLSSAIAGAALAAGSSAHNGTDPKCPFKELGITETNASSPPDTRNGTAMVGIYPCWEADEDNPEFEELNDFYAHWSVRELRLAPPMPRDYKRESRSAFIRLFVGKDVSVVGSLRIDLHDPDTTFVVPLASFSYQGLVGKGQNWSTNLVSDDQTLNFFRISPTTSAQISVTAKATSALQVQAASTVIGVLRDLATIASPGGALVTTLNRDAIQQTSRTLDNALSSIFGEKREETLPTSRQLSEWKPGAHFVIQLTMPSFVKSKLSGGATPAKGEEPLLTRWYELSLSCPRRSIFISFVECQNRSAKEAAKVLATLSDRISAQQVLNLKVQGGVTLQQFVGNHDWYSRFLRSGDNEPGNGPQAVDAAAIPASRGETIPAVATAPTVEVALDNGIPAPVAGDATPPPAPAAAAAPQTPANKAKKDSDSKPSTRSDSDYSALCSSIVNALYTVGLSRLDAQIGLWAIVTGSSDFVGIEGKVQSNDRCRSLLPLAGTTLANKWVFAVQSAPPKKK